MGVQTPRRKISGGTAEDTKMNIPQWLFAMIVVIVNTLAGVVGWLLGKP